MKNKKIQATDTLKEIPNDPKDAIKADYDQTKADLHNMKESVEDKGKEAIEKTKHWEKK